MLLVNRRRHLLRAEGGEMRTTLLFCTMLLYSAITDPGSWATRVMAFVLCALILLDFLGWVFHGVGVALDRKVKAEQERRESKARADWGKGGKAGW